MPHPPRLVPWRVAIPLTTAAAVAGAGIGFLVVSLVVNRGGGETESAGAALAAASAPPESPTASATEAPLEAPPSSGAAEQRDAAPTADAGNGSDAAAPDDRSDAGLKAYESYLFVKSSVQADVWVHGIKIGPTNQKLKLPCTTGLRFTRLGKDPGPAWISKAVSIKIPCGSYTQLELEPEDNPKPRAAQDTDNPY